MSNLPDPTREGKPLTPAEREFVERILQKIHEASKVPHSADWRTCPHPECVRLRREAGRD